MPWRRRHNQQAQGLFKTPGIDNVKTERVLLLDTRTRGLPARPVTCVAVQRGLFVRTPFRDYDHGGGGGGRSPLASLGRAAHPSRSMGSGSAQIGF